MTNEPEWMERFDKKFHGALNQIEIMANVHPHDVGKFYSEINSFIQSTIKKEKEKSFVEGQMAGGLNAFPICIEEIEKAKAELLSKIEEEVEKTPIGYMVMSGSLDEEEISGYNKAVDKAVRKLTQ